MTIIRMPGFVPKAVREWDKVFRNVNEVIQETSEGVAVIADNLPSQQAAYVTLSNNQSLPNDRALQPVAGETTVTDGGPGSSVQVGLADYGTAGEYAKVVTDSKGRVAAGAALLTSDMPEPLNHIFTGFGNPNGVVSASEGALYLNKSGGANQTLWVKESGGSGNSGWTAV